MIHVVTLSWNGLYKLQRLRPGLLRNLNNTHHEYQWYIRDNGSLDKTLETIQDWPEVQALGVSHNRDNFAQGVNSLADLAFKNAADRDLDSQFLLLLNNDVEFTEDLAISKMLNLMKDPKVGVVGARLLYQGTSQLQHAGVIFGERYGRMPYHYRHKEPNDNNSEKNRYFQAVTAALCLVRMEAFQKIGGMDPKFSWAFEDISMCLSIGGLGYKVAYCGEASAFHEESASLKKNPVNKLFMNNNVNYFKTKWSGKYQLDHEKYLNNPKYNEI